jgi:hypothetical protein
VPSLLQHPAFLLENDVFPPRLLIRVMYQYDFHRGFVRAGYDLLAIVGAVAEA